MLTWIFGIIAALTFLVAMFDREWRGGASVICLAAIAIALAFNAFGL